LNSKENETIVGLPSLVELEGLVSGLN
jgi:hypothetical protein